MDFDDGVGGPPSGWTNNVDPPGGTERVASPVRSSPNALRAWVSPASDVRVAHWARPIGATVGRAKFSYSLFVEERPTTDEVELNVLRFDSGDQQNYFYLRLAPNEAEYWEQSNTAIGEKSNPITPALPIVAGKWHRVFVELDVGVGHSIKISVDGVLIVDKQLTQASKPGTVVTTAGITWASAQADKAKVVVDDVLFETQP